MEAICFDPLAMYCILFFMSYGAFSLFIIVTHQFFSMTLDLFMDIITICEHVETISLRSPRTQNMLKSMRK